MFLNVLFNLLIIGSYQGYQSFFACLKNVIDTKLNCDLFYCYLLLLKIILMTRICLLLFIGFLFWGANANSQVTIGSNYAPAKGALLDLKQFEDTEAQNGGRNATKGLLLPKVNLTTTISLENIAIEDLSNNALYTGLTVYNLTEKDDPCLRIPAGVYTWSGKEWVNLQGKRHQNI